MTHRVYLAGREHSFAAGENETVLEAGLRQHLALPFGCKSGGCGSCRVRLLRGEVEHRLPPPALSQAERDAGYILMCLAEARSELLIDLHQPERLERLRPRQLPVRALSRTMLSHDVIGLTLKLPKGEAFDYLPGQYVDFLLEDGKRRSFSLASAPNGETLELHLRIAPGGRFAHWVRDEMPERAILRLEGPLGAFYIREDSERPMHTDVQVPRAQDAQERPMILMAGGTGFAPIKAMLEDLFARGLTRPAHLFWGARRREDLYLHELAAGWAATQPLFRYTPVLSAPDAGGLGQGEHERGPVHEAVLRAYPQLAGREVYMSGPPVMVRAGKEAFVAAGLDADHLFYDSFDYAFETWPGA